jgi:hypothetical protein
MSELMKIVLTSAVTVFGGIAVFVIGQVATKFFVEPIHEQSKAISEIIDSLVFFADLYSNPDNRNPPAALEERGEASKNLRRHASQLSSKTNAIVWYKLWEFLRVIPKRSGVNGACRGLIGLSHNLFSGTPDDAREFKAQITKGLNLPFV